VGVGVQQRQASTWQRGNLDPHSHPGPVGVGQDEPGGAVLVLLAVARQHPAEGADDNTGERLRRLVADVLRSPHRTAHRKIVHIRL
jgi:hypothetical protein